MKPFAVSPYSIVNDQQLMYVEYKTINPSEVYEIDIWSRNFPEIKVVRCGWVMPETLVSWFLLTWS